LKSFFKPKKGVAGLIEEPTKVRRMISRKEFESYEEIRNSGKTNMLIVENVCELSGLTRDQVIEIMQNYEFIKYKYR